MKKIAAYILPFLVPVMAFAQTTGTDGAAVLDKAFYYVDRLTFLAVAIGILIFIWGIIRYVVANNEEQKANAQRLILYGVIGLFAITAIWGLVKFLSNTTGVGGEVAPNLPCPPGYGC